MTKKRDAVTPTPERLAFKTHIMEVVGDLGRLCRYVLDHPALPVPSTDLFAPVTYWILCRSVEEFDRLSDVLASDGVVEHESHDRFRVCRRRFGTAALELSLSGGPSVPPFDQDAAVAEGEAS